MMSQSTRVYIVDDDAEIRQSHRWLVESMGYEVETYASGAEFLAAQSSGARGCLLLDLRLPDISGIELLRRLAQGNQPLQTVIISGVGSVENAVKALKLGAIDFLEKPVDDGKLHECIRDAIERDNRSREQEKWMEMLQSRLDTLTAREKEVMEHMVKGEPSKLIAYNLGISVKTVEVHRARVMRKTHSASLAELVKLYVEANPQR